jgi:ribokinase
MSRIVVLGDLNLDVYAIDPAGAAPGDEARAPVRAVPGGSAGTFAQTAADAGAAVTFIGCVGRDLIGDLLIRSLENRGIRAAVGRADLPSGTVLALWRGEERTMVCSRGANDGLTEAMVDSAALDEADHLHVSGYALISSAQVAAATHAIGLAHARGATISVDPPPAGLIEASGVDAFKAALGSVDWLFPNLSEGCVLTRLKEPDKIVEELAGRFAAGALTLGSGGALAWRGRERSLATPPRVVTGNPTGAGDSFAAGFVVALLSQAPLDEANRRGCAAAARHLANR